MDDSRRMNLDDFVTKVLKISKLIWGKLAFGNWYDRIGKALVVRTQVCLYKKNKEKCEHDRFIFIVIFTHNRKINE